MKLLATLLLCAVTLASEAATAQSVPFAGTAPVSLAPPAPDVVSSPGDDALRITLLTFGPGDQVWELFGHNAIWIHDPIAGTDSVYDWGRFDPTAANFYTRFLRGRMQYTMGDADIGQTLAHYQGYNRTIWAQELNLTGAEKGALREYIRWNARPENREYRYDYFLDNCSTRVRDAIDRAVGGAIGQQLSARETATTYRSHSLRLMQVQPIVAIGVDIGLGRPTDHLLTAQEEAFLPTRLQEHVREVRLPGGRSLVGSERVLFQATRAPEPSAQPAFVWMLLLASLLVAGGVVAAVRRGHRRVAAAVVAVIATVFGLVGTVLALLWIATDHTAAHRNENLLLLNPLWLVVAVVVPMALVRGRPSKGAAWISIAAAGLTGVALLMHALGLARQDNSAILALVIPVAMAVAWAMARLGRTATR